MSTVSHSSTCPVTPDGKGCTCGSIVYCKKQGCEEKTIPRGKYCEAHRVGQKCLTDGCYKVKLGTSDYCFTHGGGKRCDVSDCNKRARELSTKCALHGGGRRCSVIDCKKGADGLSDKCKKHGGGKRCEIPDCKNASQGASSFCKKHGGGIRCMISGCKNTAQSSTGKCIRHGGGERCTQSGCMFSARGNTKKCGAHGGGRRCILNDCPNLARGKSEFCSKHGGGKRCASIGCTKSARNKSEFCVEHGGGRRCPHCLTWPDSRCGSPKYDGYCATCFKRLFPDDPRSTVIHQHTKEIRVRNAINQRFTGFVHDKPLYTGHCDCTHRRRIDHRKLIGGTILAVETDEFAHRDYDQKDEEIRYDDLYMLHSGKWVYLRFNPDKTATCDTDLEDRIEVLLEEMETQIERIEKGKNQGLVEIIRLYYE